ncbi:type II toxin-antitoxin system PemK/MazF family toxin [Candidatus Poribacteria bacterium]|nr:type II toxin-antitoxin system PemK/MazF family toxin [Candidatus Poribacteria bacterium]
MWDVDFRGYIGTEIQKIRPAVVVNINSIKHLKIRLIAPITSWNKEYIGKIWIVNIKPNDFNGLNRESAVDTMQIKGADVQRFVEKRGQLTATQMDDITAAIAAIIDYQ